MSYEYWHKHNGGVVKLLLLPLSIIVMPYTGKHLGEKLHLLSGT